jgi:hypothetical protein
VGEVVNERPRLLYAERLDVQRKRTIQHAAFNGGCIVVAATGHYYLLIGSVTLRVPVDEA